MKHHVIAYNNKTVVINYVRKPREFVVACQRIMDNGADGYVLTPKGELFRVMQGSRIARPVKEDWEITEAMKLFEVRVS